MLIAETSLYQFQNKFSFVLNRNSFFPGFNRMRQAGATRHHAAAQTEPLRSVTSVVGLLSA